MTLVDDLLASNATTLDAAKELCRGLMRGARDDLKLGYSHENAAIAASSMFKLGHYDQLEVRAYALGFAGGMLDAGFTDEMAAELASHSERFRDALDAGFARGQQEDKDSIYPSGLKDAKPAGKATMTRCGCGATTPQECTAAVEGHFTSLTQRSDEQLRSLHAHDACRAALVLLEARRLVRRLADEDSA